MPTLGKLTLLILGFFFFFFKERTKLLAAEIQTIKLYKCDLNPLDHLANSQEVFNIGEVFLLLIKYVIKYIDSLVTPP